MPLQLGRYGAAPPVEYASRDAADAAVDAARRRYLAGARALRVVRVYGPDGGVRVVDFEQEAKRAERALHDVERDTAACGRAIRAATEAWEAAVARAVAAGETVESVAAAAGVTAREVRDPAPADGKSSEDLSPQVAGNSMT